MSQRYVQIQTVVGEPARHVALHPFVLYTKVDSQYDKLATVVGRSKLATLSMVDDLCQNFGQSSRVKYPYIWGYLKSLSGQYYLVVSTFKHQLKSHLFQSAFGI